jgi:FkbM family methyltransferase
VGSNQPKSRLHRVVVKAIVGVLNGLPRRTRDYVWTMFQPTGTLDGPIPGIKLHVRTKEERWRQKSCAKEPETVAWLQQNLRDDDVLYDVGANIGAYTLFACGFKKGLRAVCVEPIVSNVFALSGNLRINGFDDRVSVMNVALSDKQQMLRFDVRNDIPGTASIRAESKPENDLSQAVLCLRLDDFAALGLPSPTIMKIDIDGAEIDMMKGARETLRLPNLRTVLIEADLEQTADAVIEMAKEAGFELKEKHTRAKAICNLIFVRGAAEA